MFGILPTRVHGFLDYVIGVSLVLMAFILDRKLKDGLQLR